MTLPLTLTQKFTRHVVSESQITQSMKLVIAVSGGADSIALLHLIHSLRTDLRLSLLAVHINHHLRGDDSDADEVFVRKLCDYLNVNCIIKHVHFKTESDLENQARNARLEILHKILKSYKFDKIVLAHQKNDQTETILMNLIRGAGITGMGGMKPVTDFIIRPLLPFSRNEIENWLTANKIEWRLDKSNNQNRFTRNRVRSELVPWLQNNMNHSITDKLLMQSAIFQEADDFFKKHVKKLYKKSVLEETDTHVTVDLFFIKQLTKIEQFYLLRACYSIVSRTEQEFFMHSFNEICRLFNTEGSKKTHLAHGVIVLKEYNELTITSIDPNNRSYDTKELIIDEERTHFVFYNWRFTLKYLKSLPINLTTTKQIHNAFIDLNKISSPLRLRGRQPGDRFMPLGMSSEKKLKEFFIDEKVSKFERDSIPILVDKEKIIWVVGYRLDARAGCNEDSHRILHISVEPVKSGRKRAANRSFVQSGGKYDIYEL